MKLELYCKEDILEYALMVIHDIAGEGIKVSDHRWAWSYPTKIDSMEFEKITVCVADDDIKEDHIKYALIYKDEEGDSLKGIVKAVKWLNAMMAGYSAAHAKGVIPLELGEKRMTLNLFKD